MNIRQAPVRVIYKTENANAEGIVTVNAFSTISLNNIPGKNPADHIRFLIASDALSEVQRQILIDLYRILLRTNFFGDKQSKEERANTKLLNSQYRESGMLPGFEVQQANKKINASGTIVYNLLKNTHHSEASYQVLGGILLFLLEKGVFETPYWDFNEEDIFDLQDDNEEKRILQSSIPDTDREQLIKARRGQGLFRTRVKEIELECRLTQINDKRFLIASHIKPWSLSNNTERLDGNNGLLLSPHVDHLFDKRWISFSPDGEILCATDEVESLMVQWGLDPSRNVGRFNEKQQQYLEFHRKHRYRRSEKDS